MSSYISDSGIQVFTEEGTFLRKFGENGRGDGQLRNPRDISLDCDNLLYVPEYRYSNNRVTVFSCRGEFVTSFGSKGNLSGPGRQFNSPSCIAVDSDGVVYVCDAEKYRVQCF